MKNHRLIIFTVTLFLGILLLIACGNGIDGIPQPDVLAMAAQEATVIVQQAQATALLIQAQLKATAMVNAVNESQAKSIPTATWQVYIAPTEQAKETPNSTQEDPPDTSNQQNNPKIEVVSVGIAGDGGFIMVRFLAPPKVAEKWWQGSVSVEDENNGEVYDEIPVMPRIGPLIGRPKRQGQLGYVMLVNRYPSLEKGRSVTVNLGTYRFEHIPVQ